MSTDPGVAVNGNGATEQEKVAILDAGAQYGKVRMVLLSLSGTGNTK